MASLFEGMSSGSWGILGAFVHVAAGVWHKQRQDHGVRQNISDLFHFKLLETQGLFFCL